MVSSASMAVVVFNLGEVKAGSMTVSTIQKVLVSEGFIEKAWL
jgi:hypothetical protein